jgi:flagellar L-ring protein precursor FlgH
LFRGAVSPCSRTRGRTRSAISSASSSTEATSAAKSADTELDKSSGIEITDPTVFGAPVTINGRYNLGTSLESASAFEGEASSNQSNRLSGAIAVQVSRVLPNGNLVVQGEKWIETQPGR